MLLLSSLAFLVAAASDPVIAERGTDRITFSEARALIAGTDRATQHKLTTDKAALQQFLRDILLQRAILRDAAAEKWDRRPEVAALLRRARDEVLAQTYLAAHAPLPPGYPSDADIQSAYEANASRFMQPRSFHLEQIFLPHASYATDQDGQKLLQQLRAKVEHDALTLEAAAKGAGRFMDMGWAPENQLVPAVKAAVAGLQVGALTDPICIENGCHLIRLMATRPAGPAPLAEIRDELVRALRQQKQAQAETAFASGLLAKQPVSVNQAQLSRMVP